MRPAGRPRSGRRRAASVAVALLAVVLIGGLRPARGRADALLHIVTARHDPRGTIVAMLSTAAPADQITQVSALVDGAPRPAQLDVQPRPAAAVVIAIDTSGSMAGAPLEEAQRAAVALVGELDARDRVAVVAFNTYAQDVAPFTADRSTTIASLQGLAAGGDTALYDAIALSADLLSQQPMSSRVIVLLTDGVDHGSVLPGGGAASLQRVTAAGATVHAFAVGADADRAYLAQIAGATHGGFWSVTDAAALNDLFTRLGETLSASVRVTVQVPPLTRGDHRLEIRAQIGGALAVATDTVPVTNDGVLTARTETGGSGDAQTEVLAISSIVPIESLQLDARANGVALPVLSAPPRVLVDPWQFAPGTVDVQVGASMDGTAVATSTFTVSIPPLAPEVNATVGGPAHDDVVVTGRVQAGTPGTELVARVDGREVARGPLPSLTLGTVHGSRLDASIVAGGRVLANTTAALSPVVASTTDPRRAALPAAAGGLALLLLVALILRRRSRRRRPPSARHASAPLVGSTGDGPRGAPPDAAALVPVGILVVQPPAGPELTHPVGRKPLSLGRDAGCDIVLDDETIDPVYARLVALGDGDYRLHRVVGRDALGRVTRADDWIVVREGERISIGSHVHTILGVSTPALA